MIVLGTGWCIAEERYLWCIYVMYHDTPEPAKIDTFKVSVDTLQMIY